jgi:translation initiation factor 1 (eIF-1/SUI1)
VPKQKIEVNESLNVSIKDIIKPTDSKNGITMRVNEEMPHIELLKEASGDKTSEKPPCKKDTKPTKTNAPHSSNIKNIIPKLGKVSLQHQRAGRGGKTVTLVSISGETEYKRKHNLEALLKELKKSLGCGGQIEEGKIVLHGEIADRASEWFAKMEAKQ